MSKREPKTLTNRGPIVRGSVPYIALREVGQLGDKGKRVMSLGYKGRIVGDTDTPLATMLLPIIRELSSVVRWPTKEEAARDLDLLKRGIEAFEVN